MSFSPAFTIAQVALNPALIYATDSSTGVDAAIAKRRITFTTSTGTTLVVAGTTTSYNAWALADTTASFNVLTQDYALSILVQWLDVNNVVLYSSTQTYCLAYYNKQFMYYLTNQESLTPSILQDTNYVSNKTALWVSIQGALNAVTFGADIAASQNELNIGTNLRLNQNLYF